MRRALALAQCLLVCLAASASADSHGFTAAAGPAPPEITAQEAILDETDVGASVYSMRADREVAIASTTKMMTAYVTAQSEPLEKKLVEQPYDAGPGESLAGLVPGDSYTVADMLRAMLLPSGNDVAHSLAIDVGGTIPHFVAEMNAAAIKLGLSHTHFATAVGLDTPGNYSSAADLAKLGQVLLQNRFLASVVRQTVAYLPGGIVVYNRNKLLGAYPFVVGVKEGHTQDAGWCLVAAASWHGVHLVSVVLGEATEDAEFDDSLALLRYGLSLYHRVSVAVAGRDYLDVPANGDTTKAALVAARSASIVVERGVGFNVQFSGVPTQLQGPIAAGTPEGQMIVTENGRQVLAVPLVTQAAVAPPPVVTGPTLPSTGPTTLSSARGV